MTGRELFTFPRALEFVLGLIGVFVFVVAVWAGLFGTDTQSENFAPTAVYVLFSVGVPFLSLLLGDVWQFLSPWRAVGRATGWVAKRIGGEEGLPDPLPYPERLGRLPAAAVLFGFAICELCWARATEPGPLALIMLIYFVAMLIGMSLYGVDPWVRNADGFGVLFGLIGSLSAIGGRERRGGARAPVTETSPPAPVARTAGVFVGPVGPPTVDR